MTASGSSSRSTSAAASIPSSCCFLKPSVTVSTMRGSRVALKISLSPSMATKWRPALRQVWIDAPSMNQERCKQKNHNKKSQGHKREDNKKLSTCGCSAIKNYITDLHGRLNEQLEKDRVLLPTSSSRSGASHELSVLRHQIEEDIINGNIDTNRIKLSHRPNGECGRRHLRIAPHQQLNAKFQHLQKNITW
jgi:hypothetical protein